MIKEIMNKLRQMEDGESLEEKEEKEEKFDPNSHEPAVEVNRGQFHNISVVTLRNLNFNVDEVTSAINWALQRSPRHSRRTRKTCYNNRNGKCKRT